METYVSMLSWTGHPQPSAADVRAAILRHDVPLRCRGLHSIVILPDHGECGAVMIAAVRSVREIESLASSILPGVPLAIESMRFDDDTVAPSRIARVRAERDYLDSVLEAVIAC